MEISSAAGLEAFRHSVREWLAEHLQKREVEVTTHWGEGSDNVAIFHTQTFAEGEAKARSAAKWQKTKYEAGFGALTLSRVFGGQELPTEFEQAFVEEEMKFQAPQTTELMGVTVGMIAPTIIKHGSEYLQATYVKPLLRADVFACQLFSEPNAGSDLASMTTRAVRDGDEWVINGQKTWTSGAQHAQIGELIARTGSEGSKHAGMTAFIVPMDAEGIEVRQIRQLTGGTSFNEVFFTDVRISDQQRLGEIGEGWTVALTTLGIERNRSGQRQTGGSFQQLLALAKHENIEDDHDKRLALADAFISFKVLECLGVRMALARAAGKTPGPEGSVRKLIWVNQLRSFGNAAEAILGRKIIGDTGDWGIYSWNEHMLGAPGFRIAGGSDEIQRNIISERLLGLPREPQVK
jgi:alkylation response protein AidB-like acyl-CoA dehydrogenase